MVEFHQACTMVGGTTVYHSPTIEKSKPQVQPKSGNEIDAFVALKIKNVILSKMIEAKPN